MSQSGGDGKAMSIRKRVANAWRVSLRLVPVVAVAAACSSSSPSASAFCGTAKTLVDTAKGATDAGTAKVAFKKVTDFYQQMASSAPSELKGDMRLVADLSSRSYRLMDKNNFDFDKVAVDPDFKQFQQDGSTDEVKAASKRVGDYLSKTCGVDASDLASSSVTTG